MTKNSKRFVSCFPRISWIFKFNDSATGSTQQLRRFVNIFEKIHSKINKTCLKSPNVKFNVTVDLVTPLFKSKQKKNFGNEKLRLIHWISKLLKNSLKSCSVLTFWNFTSYFASKLRETKKMKKTRKISRVRTLKKSWREIDPRIVSMTVLS